jgi:protein-tyrosine phosphatase
MRRGEKMKKILFVCLGNICRSPMAEGMFMKKVDELGLNEVLYAESRATSNYEIGNPPHPGTRKILSQIGYDDSNKKAQKVTSEDFKNFDYIIGMDLDNVSYLKKHAGIYQDKIHLIRDINPKTIGLPLKDPYYDHTHEETYQVLKEVIPLWISKLIEKN